MELSSLKSSLALNYISPRVVLRIPDIHGDLNQTVISVSDSDPCSPNDITIKDISKTLTPRSTPISGFTSSGRLKANILPRSAVRKVNLSKDESNKDASFHGSSQTSDFDAKQLEITEHINRKCDTIDSYIDPKNLHENNYLKKYNNAVMTEEVLLGEEDTVKVCSDISSVDNYQTSKIIGDSKVHKDQVLTSDTDEMRSDYVSSNNTMISEDDVISSEQSMEISLPAEEEVDLKTNDEVQLNNSPLTFYSKPTYGSTIHWRSDSRPGSAVFCSNDPAACSNSSPIPFNFKDENYDRNSIIKTPTNQNLCLTPQNSYQVDCFDKTLNNGIATKNTNTFEMYSPPNICLPVKNCQPFSDIQKSPDDDVFRPGQTSPNNMIYVTPSGLESHSNVVYIPYAVPVNTVNLVKNDIYQNSYPAILSGNMSNPTSNNGSTDQNSILTGEKIQICPTTKLYSPVNNRHILQNEAQINHNVLKRPASAEAMNFEARYFKKRDDTFVKTEFSCVNNVSDLGGKSSKKSGLLKKYRRRSEPLESSSEDDYRYNTNMSEKTPLTNSNYIRRKISPGYGRSFKEYKRSIMKKKDLNKKKGEEFNNIDSEVNSTGKQFISKIPNYHKNVQHLQVYQSGIYGEPVPVVGNINLPHVDHESKDKSKIDHKALPSNNENVNLKDYKTIYGDEKTVKHGHSISKDNIQKDQYISDAKGSETGADVASSKTLIPLSIPMSGASLNVINTAQSPHLIKQIEQMLMNTAPQLSSVLPILPNNIMPQSFSPQTATTMSQVVSPATYLSPMQFLFPNNPPYVLQPGIEAVNPHSHIVSVSTTTTACISPTISTNPVSVISEMNRNANINIQSAMFVPVQATDKTNTNMLSANNILQLQVENTSMPMKNSTLVPNILNSSMPQASGPMVMQLNTNLPQIVNSNFSNFSENVQIVKQTISSAVRPVQVNDLHQYNIPLSNMDAGSVDYFKNQGTKNSELAFIPLKPPSIGNKTKENIKPSSMSIDSKIHISDVYTKSPIVSTTTPNNGVMCTQSKRGRAVHTNSKNNPVYPDLLILDAIPSNQIFIQDVQIPQKNYCIKSLKIGKFQYVLDGENKKKLAKLHIWAYKMKLVYELELIRSPGNPDHHRCPFTIIEIPFKCVSNIRHFSEYSVVIEVNAVPESYLGYQQYDDHGNMVGIGANYNRHKLVDFTNGELSKIPYHEITLTSPQAKNALLYLVTCEPRLCSVIEKPMVLIPKRKLSPEQPRIDLQGCTSLPGVSVKHEKNVNLSRVSQSPKCCMCSQRCQYYRCGCVMRGMFCSDQCKCHRILDNCSNPINILINMGLRFEQIKEDPCLMANLRKVLSPQQLQKNVTFRCCGYRTTILKCVPSVVTCKGCRRTNYQYSWCHEELCSQDSVEVRHHCEECGKCAARGELHCQACERCHIPGSKGCAVLKWKQKYTKQLLKKKKVPTATLR